jgi:outer membrane protein
MDAGAGTTPIILYAASEENNATNLILRKLGVDPDKVEAAAPVGTAPAKPAATTPATAPAAAPKKK